MTRQYIIYQDVAEPPSLEVPSCASWMPPLHQPDPAHWTRRWSMAALTAVVMAYGAPEIAAPVTGTMAVTEAADTAAFSGTVTGSKSHFEGLAQAPITDGPITIQGEFAYGAPPTVRDIAWFSPLSSPVLLPRQLTRESSALPWPVPLTGDVAATEATDVAAFSGTVEWVATMAATDAVDTAAMSGNVISHISWLAPLAEPVLTPRKLTPEGIDTVFQAPLAGDLAVTEAADAAAFSGTVAGTISLDWYTQPFLPIPPEGALVVGGYVLIGHEVSNVAWMQQLAGPVRVRQTLLLQGGEARHDGVLIAPVTGTMAVTDAADTAAASGTVEWIGTLAATDGQDTASFDGDVIVIGNLSATDAIDTASMSGTVFALPVTGTMSVTDTIDTAAVSGAVAWGAAMAATEASDTAAFDGDIITIGNMAASEPQDQADFRAPGVRYVPNYTKTVSMSRLPLRASYRWSGRRRGR